MSMLGLLTVPWILIGLVGLAVVVGIVVLIVVLCSGSKKSGGSQQFEVLPDPKPETPPRPAAPVPPQNYENDLTVQLFDHNAYGSSLKSYVLEIHDLRHPGQRCQVNVDDRITIGRSSQCTVCIPNKTLSGKHCEIALEDGKLLLRDLESLNGTYLNGNPNKVGEAYLESGSIIQIGSEKLQIYLREINI